MNTFLIKHFNDIIFKNIIKKMSEKDNLNHDLILIEYLKNNNKVYIEMWCDFCDWAVHYNDGSGEILSILEDLTGLELSDAEYDIEIDNLINLVNPNYFNQLSIDIQSAFLLEFKNDKYNTKSSFSLLNDDILSEDTLLIHFTDEPENICNNGFLIGVRDIGFLGETVRLPDNLKISNGYNFAYFVDQENFAIQDGAWRKNSAIVFKSSCVHVQHYGDKEEQVIFWGKNANLNNCFILNKSNNNEWFIDDNEEPFSLKTAIEHIKFSLNSKKYKKLKK